MRVDADFGGRPVALTGTWAGMKAAIPVTLHANGFVCFPGWGDSPPPSPCRSHSAAAKKSAGGNPSQGGGQKMKVRITTYNASSWGSFKDLLPTPSADIVLDQEPTR